MNFLKIKNKPVNWKRKFDLPVAWACMYTVLRIEVSIKQNISAIAIKMKVFYLVGLYLAISAVITQRSQCVFFLFSFSVLRCRSCLGLDLHCVVWCRASVDTSGFCTGISSEFSVPCAICTSTARLRKLWKVKTLILIRLPEYVETATASMNDCYTRYLPSTANSRCSKNVFSLQLGSRYLSRLLSPDSEETQKREK